MTNQASLNVLRLSLSMQVRSNGRKSLYYLLRPQILPRHSLMDEQVPGDETRTDMSAGSPFPGKQRYLLRPQILARPVSGRLGTRLGLICPQALSMSRPNKEITLYSMGYFSCSDVINSSHSVSVIGDLSFAIRLCSKL